MSKQTALKRVLFLRSFKPIVAGLFLATFFALLFSFALTSKTEAAQTSTINFQARLENSTGSIVPDGYYNVEFKLYSASTGGTALWTEDWVYSSGNSFCTTPQFFASGDCRLRVVNGYLSVPLGALTAFPSTINWNQNLWLTMNIGGSSNSSISYDGEMSPRIQLTASAYAFSANQLSNYAAGSEEILQFTGSPAGAVTVSVPDTTGTVCLDGLTACGFAPGTSGSYIQNGTSVQTGANLNIRSNAIGSATGVLQGANGQTADILDIQSWNGSSATTMDSFAANGNLNVNGTALTSTALTFGGASPSISASTTNTGLTLTANGTGTLTLGQSSSTNTINIGGGTGATAVNISNGNAAGSIQLGNDFTTGTIAIGGASQTGTITLGQATTNQAINIGNAQTATGNTNTINVGSSATGTGKAAITIGNTNAASSLLLQAGTGNISLNTGATSGTSGSINLQTGSSSTGASGNITIDDGTNVTSGTVEETKTFEDDTTDNLEANTVGGYTNTVAVSTAKAHTGTHSLAVTDVSPGTSWSVVEIAPFGSAFTVVPGQVYSFSAWVLAGSSPGTINFSAVFSNDGYYGAGQIESDQWGTVTDNSSTWTEVTGSVVAPVDSTKVAVNFLSNTAAAGDVHYVDDISITDLTVSNAPAINIGSANAQFIQIGNVNETDSTNISGGAGGINIGSNGVGNTIQIGNTTGSVYQAINIGNNGTASSTTNATIGSTVGGSALTLQAGTGNISLSTGSSSGDINLTTDNANSNVTIQSETNNNFAFQVQNAGGSNVLTVSTQNGQTIFGSSTGSAPISGTIIMNNSTNANTVTITTGATSSSYSITLPTVGPGTNQCLSTTSSATQLSWISCFTNQLSINVAGGTSTDGTPASISYTPANNGDLLLLTIAIPNTTSYVTSVSGGHATGWAGVTEYTSSLYHVELWKADVNGSGSTTITVNYSGTPYNTTGNQPKNEELTVEEFTTASPSTTNWLIDNSNYSYGTGTSNPAVTYPSVTASNSNEAYWGYAYLGEPLNSTGSCGLYFCNTTAYGDVTSWSTTNGAGLDTGPTTVTQDTGGSYQGGFESIAATIEATSTAGSSGSYINNSTATQSANLNVQAASSGSVAATFQANASGSGDILDLKNGAGNIIDNVTSTGNIDVGQNGTPTSQLYVSGQAPNEVSKLTGISNNGGSAGPDDVVTQGNYAYLTDSNDNTIKVYDIGVPTSTPVQLSSVSTDLSGPQSDYISGRYLYVASPGNSRLVIFDISNPASPTAVGFTSSNLSNPYNVYVSGRYAYVADNSNGLVIFDIASPASPLYVATINTNISGAEWVDVQGTYAYVASSGNNELDIFNISTPASPTYVGQLGTDLSAPRSVSVSGHYAYIASLSNGKIVVYNVSNPASPTLVGENSGTGSDDLTGPNFVTIQGRYAYVSDSSKGKIFVYDVSSGTPVYVAQNADTDTTCAYAISVDGRYAYVPNFCSGKLVVEDLGGAYVQQLEVGSTLTGSLQVATDTNIYGNTSIQGGLSVGGSAELTGNVAVNGNLNTVGYLQIGSSGANTNTTALLILNNYSTVSSDPPETDGAMYYNSGDKSFRCGENGVWRDCLGGLVYSEFGTSIPGGDTLTQTTHTNDFSSNYTVLSGDCEPGVTYLITAQGTWTTSASTGTLPSMTLYLDKDNTSTNLLASTSVQAGGVGFTGWEITAQMVCDSTTSVEIQGNSYIGFGAGSTITGLLVNNSTISWSSSAHTLSIGAVFNSTNYSPSATIRQFIVQRLGP